MSNYRDEFLENTYYLIFNQGFSNKVLFENNDDYKTFILYVMSNILEYSGIIISAYSILPNAFYFVIKNQEKGYKLSDFMRKTQVGYAMYFKKKQNNHDTRGVPVFEGRFKAIKIELDELDKIESCVAFEPLRIGLVENIQNRPYSSIHQVTNTGYNPMAQPHIKIYNDGRLKQKMFFKEQFLKENNLLIA